MKMRMKTRMAGTIEAPIIQAGKGCLSPKGLMSQPLLSGEVTEKPDGTLSFYKEEHKNNKLLRTNFPDLFEMQIKFGQLPVCKCR